MGVDREEGERRWTEREGREDGPRVRGEGMTTRPTTVKKGNNTQTGTVVGLRSGMTDDGSDTRPSSGTLHH